MTELIGWAVTVVAVTGVVFNNHKKRACFYLWLASNATSAGLHINARMYSLATRDIIFFGLAIYGLILWSKK